MIIPKKPFYFMRQGETEWNRKSIAMGWQDVALSAHGKQQALDGIAYLEDLDIERIIVSPLKRTRETVEIVNQVLQKELIVEEGLKACSFG